MSAITMSTAGVTVNYAVEATAGTRPTTGYIKIPSIKSVPEMNPSPETLETTDLSQTEFKTYVEGLKDLGGALAFLANFTTELEEAWTTLVSAYKTAKESGKAVWFEIKHPGLEKSVFFTGQPSAMGLPAMAVNSVLETNLYITPTNAPTWQAKTE
ncbi:hypothetical protein AALI59_12365 [Thomasclavelia cocleata]|uniref:hypothetical protein n=1 Tax=Thomasclavelia cocleata TaxID=69824 RepID=UPI003516CF39